MMQIWKMAIPEWPKMLQASFWAFLTTASSIGLLMCSGFIITRASFHPSIAVLSVAIVGVRFFGISRGIFRWLDRMVAHETALRLLERFRIWFYEKLEPLVPIGVRHIRNGELFHALARDVDQLEYLYARVVAPPLVALWTAVLMTILLFPVKPVFLAVFICFQFLAIGVSLSLSPALRASAKTAQRLASELQGIFLEMQQGRAELKVAGTWSHWLQECQEMEARHNRSVARTNWLVHLGEAFIPLLAFLAVATTLYLGAQMVYAEALSGVALATITLGIWASFESVQAFPALAHALQTSTASGKNLLAIAEIPSPVAPVHTPPNSQAILLLQNISFTWPDGETLFRDFSLHLEPGDAVALLGDSGSGKSTLANIIAGFLAPSSGQVRLGAGKIAILDQFPQIFTGSLADNLKIAQPSTDLVRMQKVLEQVGLWDWAQGQSPENPCEAWVGEQGAILSGGQRQRLAAARILLFDAKLVILDEPAAHLDPESESALFDVFLENTARNQSALIVITHRREFLHRFNRICIIGV